MAPIPNDTALNAVHPPSAASNGFRLGEGQNSDASDTEDDNDQSAIVTRGSPSPQSTQPLQPPQPSQQESKSTRSSRRRKNKQDRAEIGALQDNLDIVLEKALLAPDANAAGDDVAQTTTEQADADQIMEVEPTDSGKKMNKRTRQNMARMLARKQNGDRSQVHKELSTQDQIAAAARRGMTLEDYQKQRRRGGGREAGQANERRLKKQKQRARKAEDDANRMEIG